MFAYIAEAPMILYYIFVASLAFVAHPWFGVLIGGITVEKIVGLSAFLYAVVHLAFRQNRPAFIDTWPSRAFLVYFLVVLISRVGFSREVETNQMFGFHAFNFMVLVFMTVSVVDSIPRLRFALLAAIASIAWAALYMIRDWQGGMATYGYGYRPGYVVGDPNYFASSALLCLPLAYYLSRSSPNRWIRWSCIGSLLLGLAALTLSASRGGFVGLMVVAVLMVWRFKHRMRAFIGMVVLLGAFMTLSPNSPLDRLLHPSAADESSTEARRILWGTAWRMFCDNPLTGVGLGNFPYYAPRYFEHGEGLPNALVHNEYLELLAQMGLPGLLAYLGMVVASLATLDRVRRSAERSHSKFLARAALGLELGLTGFSVSVFFLSASFLRLFWFVIAISACMPALAEAEARRWRRAHATSRGSIRCFANSDDAIQASSSTFDLYNRSAHPTPYTDLTPRAKLKRSATLSAQPDSDAGLATDGRTSPALPQDLSVGGNDGTV